MGSLDSQNKRLKPLPLFDFQRNPKSVVSTRILDLREFQEFSAAPRKGDLKGTSQFCKFALIPQPLLPKKRSRIGSPSPALGEGFRVRATKVGYTRLKKGDKASLIKYTDKPQTGIREFVEEPGTALIPDTRKVLFFNRENKPKIYALLLKRALYIKFL
ncbi:hypothetical protein [Thermoleptolyngbya sp. C42_A2020_037]|uniref:hypothetical protein n=1 Tax=Thermoleptolyngbya sp. C42_A2020_037 TaxID=2747799 RepID=UPI0025F19884|nr:hypothetical protein [Thermoleptolyngbya sp. C42_A2020_037]